MNENYKISVFFDSENIPAEKVPLIIDFLSGKGDILFSGPMQTGPFHQQRTGRSN